MSFGPLRVEIHLIAPLYLTGQPLHLDALLAFERVRHEPGRSSGPHSVAWEPTEAEEVSLPLAVLHDGPRWWYRCSAAWPTGTGSRQFWGKRFDGQHLDMVDMGKATQVVTTLGPFKAMKVPVEAAMVPSLVFWAIGERERVKRGLKRLRFLGKKGAQGYGEVSRVEVETVDAEPTIWDLDWRREDGRPARNLPATWARERGLQVEGEITAPLRPPYWRRSEAVTCRVAR